MTIKGLLLKSPWKMASKKLNFSTMEFLAISPPIWLELITNTFQNEIWHTMRLLVLCRHIRDSQERPPDMVSQSEFDRNQPRKAKNALISAFLFCMFHKSLLPFTLTVNTTWSPVNRHLQGCPVKSASIPFESLLACLIFAVGLWGQALLRITV